MPTELTLSEACWTGIASTIRIAVSNGGFGFAFPEICPDGTTVYATDTREFTAALEGLALPSYTDRSLPDSLAILDLIEFCHEKIAKAIEGGYHSYYTHAHLSFDKEAGQRDFRETVNRIFLRNRAAYRINESGHVERLVSAVLHEDLRATGFNTGDRELDALLEASRRKFLDYRPEGRREALEKLWDAWERLKTLENPTDKKKSVGAILDKACSEPKLREKLEAEAVELTKIGNNFHIRHFEVDKTPISSDEHVDYLFHRMFALIRLLLRASGRGH